jgi:hypothetical protein
MNGPKNKQKVEKHQDRLSNVWHYLKLSATPKAHLVEGHVIGLCKKHNGFGGLKEDEGKRAHQTGGRMRDDAAIWPITRRNQVQ